LPAMLQTSFVILIVIHTLAAGKPELVNEEEPARAKVLGAKYDANEDTKMNTTAENTNTKSATEGTAARSITKDIKTRSKTRSTGDTIATLAEEQPLQDSQAALVEMEVTDIETNSTHLENFLYMPKTFQYTVTNCFCGGNCQEIYDPDVWKCNDTCRRICQTSCTVCGTRQI